MTTHQPAIQRYRRPKGLYPKRRDTDHRPNPLPGYLEAHEVDVLVNAAPNAKSLLLFSAPEEGRSQGVGCSVLEARDLALDPALLM